MNTRSKFQAKGESSQLIIVKGLELASAPCEDEGIGEGIYKSSVKAEATSAPTAPWVFGMFLVNMYTENLESFGNEGRQIARRDVGCRGKRSVTVGRRIIVVIVTYSVREVFIRHVSKFVAMRSRQM